ncbi:RE1-silencing transcription factor [Musca domestica]|uniref:RE1-silencing transcription factor n=1 Tax=Musca domestica TaxID=7370 RepID=A0A9J7I339_MUSDO|nr:RE1-silencing transcription factor [Musca domestica]
MENKGNFCEIFDYQSNEQESTNPDNIDCGTITYNSKTRILQFICLFCKINYENIEYFCQHLSEHIDDTIPEDVEEDLIEYSDFDEIAGEIYEEREEQPLVSKDDNFLYKLENDASSVISTVESLDNNATKSASEDLEQSDSNDHTMEVTEATSDELSSWDRQIPCYASSVPESEKSKIVSTGKTFEECFLKETNIEKIRTEGIVIEKEPPVRYPHKNKFAKELLRPKPKRKKVTTVKVIAVKNRISEIYERIKSEQTKSQQILSSNGYLNQSHSTESLNCSVEEQDIQDSFGDDKNNGNRKLVGETLITLIPEGAKIPNALPSPADGLSKSINITTLRKGAPKEDHQPSTSKNKDSHDTRPICPACGKIFRSHFSLTIHKRIHYLESDSSVKLALACPDCNQLFNKLTQLKQHIESVHYPDGFVCKICNRKLNSLSLLERHMIKVHLDRPFNCQQCGKNFSDPVTFEEHVISHNSHKVHKCRICGRKYSTEFFLMEHMRNHKEQIRQTCVVCGKVTLRITQHMKIHTPRPKRLLSCSVCGKVFNFSSGLSHHFKIMHKLPRPPPKMKKDNPSANGTTKRRRKPRAQKNAEDNINIITDTYNNTGQIIEEPSEIPDEVYNDEDLSAIKESSRHTDHIDEDENPTHFNHLLDHETGCHPSFDPEEVNHKEEEAKRVIVELIQNSSYPSFFPDNLSCVLEVTPPIAAREETISAVNSIVHDC